MSPVTSGREWSSSDHPGPLSTCRPVWGRPSASGNDGPVPGIASFHLVRDHSAARALARLALDRRMLRRVDGLRFWRLLGTGGGRRTTPGADLRRTALFAIWRDEASLDAFEDSMTDRWAGTEEAWHVRLRAAGGHGAWRGVDVLGEIGSGSSAGPIAVVTRASVRVGSWRSFRAASPAIDAELASAEGLLDVVAIGEAPVGLLGTFSLWHNVDAMRAFAAGRPKHAEVVRRTRRERWYREELFARFEPYASSGSWDGRDPLAEIGRSMP